MIMGIFRYFHSTLRCQNSNISPIALLRKKTGFGLSNIRKALESSDNDVVKAEKLLKEQAKALGWTKLTKVQDRQAVQGLIGIAVENKKVAVVEVNCETDFVSKNEKFISLVELVAKTCLKQPVLTSGLDTNKVHFSPEEIGKLKAQNNYLADEVALLVGFVGENAILKKAFCYETSRNDIDIAVAVHPPCENSVLLGKYGAFLSYQRIPDAPVIDNLESVVHDICVHIIGANPVKIGEYGKDEPSENVNEEKILIHQDFLLNDSMTVGQLMTNSGIKILDFKRFSCGASFNNTENSATSELDDVEKSSEIKV